MARRHPDYGTANTLFKLKYYIELLAAEGNGMAADIVNGILVERGPCLGGLVLVLKMPRPSSPTPEALDCRRQIRCPAMAKTSRPAPSDAGTTSSGTGCRPGRLFVLYSTRLRIDPPEATPTAGEPISGVDHVVVKTQSAEAAKRFYGEQLGVRLALEQDVPEWGGTQLFFERVPCRLRSLHQRKPPNKTSCGDWR
ncbi:MAG: hypothetical protein CM15mP74_16450 [Halieaceae bacterium]|nr:MAG: hypothetical protein CM15mP74_16450 [Halieaceae bacterium]